MSLAAVCERPQSSITADDCWNAQPNIIYCLASIDNSSKVALGTWNSNDRSPLDLFPIFQVP